MSLMRFLLHKIALWAFNRKKDVPETIKKLPLCWHLQKDDTHGQKYTQLYQKGIFTWVGHTLENVVSPFAYPQNTPKNWITYAHGFDWLFYTPPNAYHKCLQWILQWHQDFGDTNSNIAWDLYIVAHRLTNWLRHYENLTGHATYTDRTQFHQIIYDQYQFLCYFRTTNWVARQKPTPPECIHIYISIVCASIALNDNRFDIKSLCREIIHLLDDVMDTDGFVCNDLPTHIGVLKSTILLRATLYSAKIGNGEIWDSYVNKMWKVVQFFYNTNKDFSHMAGATALNHQYHILKQQCPSERKTLPSLTHSQYFVVHTDMCTAYIDAMPRNGQPTDTAGMLGLTLYSKKHPIFVACGYSNTIGDMCKYSATHNTIIINDTNCVPLGKKTVAPKISATQKHTPPWHILGGMHNGYVEKFGVRITRKIGIKEDGTTVQGRDSVIFVDDFATAEPLDIAIRFHLHPNIRAMQLQNNDIILTAKKTNQVSFSAKNCTIHIENSYHIDENSVYKATEQLVLRQKYTPQVLGEKDIHIDWTICIDKG